MSYISGKCDLMDHISMEKWRTKDGSDKKEDLEEARVLYSDLMECFEIFKERTGGVIYQHKCIKNVSEWNQDAIKEHCPEFDIIKHVEQVPDKRTKDGIRERVTYTYKYWGKEYTAKELKQRGGIYVKDEIHFDTLLELLPFMGYIVSACCSNEGKETVFITNRSFTEQEHDEMIELGYFSNRDWYYKRLADLYLSTVLRYFNPENRSRYEQLTFRKVEDEDGDVKYVANTSKPIDYNFNVTWDWSESPVKSHWCSPKVLDYDKGLIEMHETDFKHFLGDTMRVHYVEKQERKLYLE